MIRAGDLRHRIELQSPTDVTDNMGGMTRTWSTVQAVAAAVWPTPAKEAIRGGALTMIGTYNVRIRYYSGLGADWRIKFGTRYFSIVSIVDENEKHVQMDLLCREVVA